MKNFHKSQNLGNMHKNHIISANICYFEGHIKLFMYFFNTYVIYLGVFNLNYVFFCQPTFLIYRRSIIFLKLKLDLPLTQNSLSEITFYSPVTNHDNFLPGYDIDYNNMPHFCIIN